MRIVAVAVYTAIVVTLMSAAPGIAQQKAEPYFKNGTINFDRQKIKKELEQHERDTDNLSRSTRSLRKNEFCIVCE